MDSLIQIINTLQDVFSVIGEHTIDLPQIVVVGSQSSGKSSVLESLVGHSFLPRGTGIVTRAPLIIQMIKYNDKDYEDILKISPDKTIQSWCTFLHEPKTIYYDFDIVRKEIEARTDFLAGSNKGITHDPITLRVYTQLYNLTFIDLPGITKIPIGDQPDDIDEQIKELINKYVKQANSIILAIVTANTDVSTSESIQIARKVDPDGDRTIAVVTKLDLIDKGTLNDSKELLCGEKIKVKLGIIGVVNRSQKDINDNKSMKETLQCEKEFLRKNYPDIYKKHGNSELANSLQNILIEHIKKTYPPLLQSLQATKMKLEEELTNLMTPENLMIFVMELLKDIAKSYIDMVNGNQKDLSSQKIMGGAQIAKIMNVDYVEKLNEIDPLVDLTDNQIEIILLNSTGTKMSSFIDVKALRNMVSLQLEHLIEPSLSCVDSVRVEMVKIFDCIDGNTLEILKRFPKLNTKVSTKYYFHFNC